MFVASRFGFTLKFLPFAVLYLAAGWTQAATHSIQLDDFHPNCNFRQLNLTQEQHNAMRKIRSDYKSAADKAFKKELRADRTRRKNIIEILSKPNFDQNSARDYVESRYLSSMDFAVDELTIQHRIYHLLSPGQRQIWLDNCLR